MNLVNVKITACTFIIHYIFQLGEKKEEERNYPNFNLHLCWEENMFKYPPEQKA